MVRACSAVREARAKVSSSTKTAFFRRSFWRDSKLEDISVRFVMAAVHLSSPFPFSSIVIFSTSSSFLPGTANGHRLIGMDGRLGLGRGGPGQGNGLILSRMAQLALPGVFFFFFKYNRYSRSQLSLLVFQVASY